MLLYDAASKGQAKVQAMTEDDSGVWRAQGPTRRLLLMVGGLGVGLRIERGPIDTHGYWILLELSKALWMNGIPVTAAAGGTAAQLHYSPGGEAENRPSYDTVSYYLVRSAVDDELQTHHSLIQSVPVNPCPDEPSEASTTTTASPHITP